MNCTEFDAIVVDLTRARPMDAARRAQAEAHARECERCRESLSVQRDVTEHLGALRSAASHVAAPAELEGALVAAFRAQSTVAPAKPAQRPTIRAWWWLGAAAALALAIGGAAAVMSVSRTKPGITTARTAVPAVDTSPAGRERVPEVGSAPTATEAVGQVGDAVSARTAAPRSKPRRRMAPAAPQDAMVDRPAYATLPASLPRWSDAPLVPVRLQLPYAALPALGLQSTREQWGETVPVEVLVGEDGIARGIRLVDNDLMKR